MKVRFQDPTDEAATPVSVEAVRREGRIQVTVGGRTVEVTVGTGTGGALQLAFDGKVMRLHTCRSATGRTVSHAGKRWELARVEQGASKRRSGHEGAGSGEHVSMMPGQVLKVMVEVGSKVQKGQGLLILEAMKMEHELKAQISGVVVKVEAAAGRMVNPGALLVEVQPEG